MTFITADTFDQFNIDEVRTKIFCMMILEYSNDDNSKETIYL